MAIRTVYEQLPIGKESPQWFAFRTMYKREKMVAKRLNAKALETYVPLRTIVRHYSSKTTTTQVPLFSSYVFVRLSAKQYATVLNDDDVFEIVKFQGEVGRIKDEEIEFLKEVLRDNSNDYDVKLYEGLEAGVPIVLAGGPLAGTKGKILRSHGNHNFVVELNNLGVSIQLTVDRKYLSKGHAFTNETTSETIKAN